MKALACRICGAHRDAVEQLIQVNDGAMSVCSSCIDDLHQFLMEGRKEKVAEQETQQSSDFDYPTPSRIISFLDRYVIGQGSAKQALALAVYNHYKRLRHQGQRQQGDTAVEIDKSNVLLIGPTGTGKTLLARSIARLLDVPFTIADATSLTQAGYVGDDVETILQRLIEAADGDVEKAQQGIVFIDEVDKLAKASAGTSVTRDVSGEGVQQALLKIIEGAKVSVPVSGSRKTPGAAANFIDTRNILFICGGAFVSLMEGKRKEQAKLSVGFTPSTKMASEDNDEVQPEDLFKFGLIPEFVGRLPVITTLDELTVDDIERILVEPQNSVVKQMQQLLAMDRAQLDFEHGAVAKIAQKAMELKTGARGARSVLEKLLKQAMLQVPDQPESRVLVKADLSVQVVAASDSAAANETSVRDAA